MQLIKSQEELVSLARSMAAEFALLKSKEYIAIFLKDSHLGEELFALYEKEQFKHGRTIIEKEAYLNHLNDDYEQALGKIIAISYAIGMIDAAEKVPPNLYKQKKSKANKPQITNLILPQGE